MSLTFKNSLDFGWPELYIIFWLVQLEKTGDDDRRHSSYIFAVGATTTESGRPEHIGTWGIFPITSKEKCQRKAQPYRGKLNGKNSTTPRSSTSLGPRRKKLYEEPEPWLQGFAPKSRNEHEPFVNGQAPNCPEIPRSQLIHPSGWYQDTDGNWFNDSVCSEGEDEDKVGSVEPSEEEGNRKKR